MRNAMVATHLLPSSPASTAVAALRALTGALLLACLCDVAAQESLVRETVAAGVALAAASNAAAAPPSDELTALRSRLQAPAVPLSSLNARALNESVGAGRRVWFSHGRVDVGVGVDNLRYELPPARDLDDLPPAVVGAVPALTVGVRYRLSDAHAVFAGAYGARGLATDPSIPLYAAKVGVEWRPAKSRLGLEHGAIGMHFDSGYKLSLKVRHGGPTMYLRGQF